jgi:hypothetical protein
MVYRELPLEQAEQAFGEITATVVPQEPAPRKGGYAKKVVKPLPRKSK